MHMKHSLIFISKHMKKHFPLKIIKPNKKYIKKRTLDHHWTSNLNATQNTNYSKKKIEHPTYMHISKYKQ